jgi:hypothetical protein
MSSNHVGDALQGGETVWRTREEPAGEAGTHADSRGAIRTCDDKRSAVALEGTEAGLDHVRLACYGAIAFRRAAGGWTVRVPAFPSISAHAESQEAAPGRGPQEVRPDGRVC